MFDEPGKNQGGWSIAVALATAAPLFVALALVWTLPLALHISSAIPGAGAGDNVAVLWDFWWARFAVAHDLPFFRTTYLFAPHETNLALHTHLFVPALIGARMLGGVSLVTAHNVLLIATLALNGLAAFTLSFRLLHRWDAALISGVVFSGSAFFGAHLHGHFNVLSAWTLPIVALLALEARRGGFVQAASLGAVLGLTVLLDYYYAVYAVAIIAVVWTYGDGSWSFTFGKTQSTGARRVLVLAALTAGVSVAIALSGGFDLEIKGLVLRARDSFNTEQATGLLLGIWLWMRWRPRVTRLPRSEDGWTRPGTLLRLISVAAVASIVALPVIVPAIQLIWSGDYVAPRLFWRSGSGGVDLVTTVLGNPYNALTGPWTTRVYERLSIDPIEQSAWLGVVPVVLAVMALRHRDTAIRLWAIIGGLALLWALGPHLTIFGWHTGFMLPNAVLRFVPVVSNARIPGRAMVIVTLAVSILAGAGWNQLTRSGRARPWWVLVALILIVIDLTPAPFPIVALDRPALYDLLRADPQPGSVLELPLGVRDGFGEQGLLDHRVLYYQSIHERPLVGGFVARLPISTRAALDGNDLVQDLLTLSSSGPPPQLRPEDTDRGDRDLERLGVAFVVVDGNRASDLLKAFVAERLPLQPIASESGRTLFRVVRRPSSP